MQSTKAMSPNLLPWQVYRIPQSSSKELFSFYTVQGQLGTICSNFVESDRIKRPASLNKQRRWSDFCSHDRNYAQTHILIFQSVKRLILYVPTSATSPHDVIDILLTAF